MTIWWRFFWSILGNDDDMIVAEECCDFTMAASRYNSLSRMTNVEWSSEHERLLICEQTRRTLKFYVPSSEQHIA